MNPVLKCIALATLALTTLAPAARAADAALIEAAKKEGQIVWYTVQTIPQVVTPLVAAFEKKYGVKVQYVRANSSEVVLRILNEAKAGKSLSDVFDGTGTTPPLKREGLARKWLPDFTASWPKELVDPEGFWVATNSFVNTVGINTTMVKPADEPKTWDDLADPKWKGKMMWGSQTSPSAGPGFVGLMLKTRGEAKARELLDKLAKQSIAGQPVAARQVLDQVIAGEYAIGLMIFNHHAVISAAQGAPVKWLPVGPAGITLNVASVARDAPHPNAAKLFLDFMVSEEGQVVFRDSDYLPANPKVPAKDPTLLPDGVKFTGYAFTPEEIETDMPKWNKMFQEIFR